VESKVLAGVSNVVVVLEDRVDTTPRPLKYSQH